MKGLEPVAARHLVRAQGNSDALFFHRGCVCRVSLVVEYDAAALGVDTGTGMEAPAAGSRSSSLLSCSSCEENANHG